MPSSCDGPPGASTQASDGARRRGVRSGENALPLLLGRLHHGALSRCAVARGRCVHSEVAAAGTREEDGCFCEKLPSWVSD